MKYYAQFFHRSAIDQNKIIEACGGHAPRSIFPGRLTMKKPDSGIQIGAYGSILTIDNPNFWIVTGVHAFNLIVTSAANPKKWRAVHPDDFWVLIDRI